ncbi:MAG: ABC transporter ATP-binding protein [Bdellovibrionota bacterium]
MKEMSTQSFLKAEALCKTYDQAGERVSVLKNINLELSKGDFIALLGASGSGKSTLLHCLGLLDTWDSGEVFFEGRPLSKLSEKEQARFRLEKLGFVFQFHHLIPELSAEENVALPASILGANRSPRARELLDWVGLSHKLKSFPWQLSGGEQQRVALARALINDPVLLLTDEVTGNLDRARSKEILELLRRIHSTLGTTILSVTHDEELAASYDRRIRLSEGQL